MTTYSIVIPVYNEEHVVPVLLHRLDALMQRLDASVEVIFVDDGSQDTSPIVLKAKANADSRFKYIRLSRNFGHQAALTAGLQASSGKAVIVMDADLQDPPEVVVTMIEHWKNGAHIVYGMRLRREGETFFKLLCAKLFYKALDLVSATRIPPNVGDFRLVDRKVVDAFLAMPEHDRMVRGMFAWLGFRQVCVEFDRPGRVAGNTKYTFIKQIRLAVNAIIGFSDAPLRLAIWLGLTVSGFAVIYGCYAVIKWFTASYIVEGWTSIIVVVSFLSGMNMLLTGVLGIYIGKIYTEVRRRPVYVVEDKAGFESKQNVPDCPHLREAS